VGFIPSQAPLIADNTIYVDGRERANAGTPPRDSPVHYTILYAAYNNTDSNNYVRPGENFRVRRGDDVMSVQFLLAHYCGTRTKWCSKSS